MSNKEDVIATLQEMKLYIATQEQLDNINMAIKAVEMVNFDDIKEE